MTCLEARQLSKSFSGRQVVDKVSLHVDSGEVVGLLGHNGAGKTTCFYMIVGLIPSDSGSVWLDDRELTRFPMHVRARHGVFGKRYRRRRGDFRCELVHIVDVDCHRGRIGR